MRRRERVMTGDRVMVRAEYVPGHIRMPAYIRGKAGVVVNESPAYPFPDAHAHGVAATEEPTCDVRFSATDFGRTRPTRHSYMPAYFRATCGWNDPATRGEALSLALAPSRDSESLERAGRPAEPVDADEIRAPRSRCPSSKASETVSRHAPAPGDRSSLDATRR